MSFSTWILKGQIMSDLICLLKGQIMSDLICLSSWIKLLDIMMKVDVMVDIIYLDFAKVFDADDLVVISETEDDLIKGLNEWKDFVEYRGMRVNINKTKVMINGEWQKVMQKAARWTCGVCGRGVGNNSIQCTSCQK